MKLGIDIYTKGKRKLLFKKRSVFCKRRDVYYYLKKRVVFFVHGAEEIGEARTRADGEKSCGTDGWQEAGT